MSTRPGAVPIRALIAAYPGVIPCSNEATPRYAASWLKDAALVWLLLVLLWLLCTVLATGVFRFSSSDERSLAQRLHRHGTTTTATVVDLEPKNHGSMAYNFSFNGKSYSGGADGEGREGDVENLKLGQSVHIAYDRTDPEYSCYCDPRSLYSSNRLWSDLLPGALLGAFLTALLLGGARFVRSALSGARESAPADVRSVTAEEGRPHG